MVEDALSHDAIAAAHLPRKVTRRDYFWGALSVIESNCK